MDEIHSLLSTWGGAITVVPLSLALGMGLRDKLPKAVAPAMAAALVTGVMFFLGEHEPMAMAAPLIIGALMVLAMRGQDQMWPVLLSLALAGPAAWLLMYGEVPAQAVTPPAQTASAPRPAAPPASQPARSASDAELAAGGGGRLGLVLDGQMAKRGDRPEGSEDTGSKPAMPAGSLGRPAPAPAAVRPVAPTPTPPAPPALPPMSNAPVTIPVVPGEQATPTYVPPVASGQVQNSTGGQHPGFAANCRWVSPTVWSCPDGSGGSR